MYLAVFGVCVVLASALTLKARAGDLRSGGSSTSPQFERFKWTYLTVYYLMVAADWLQGPYVYALYASYGFSKFDIAVLFVAGFGSSFVVGTFVGGLADQFGRRKWAQLYVVLYVLSCVTKHFRNFGMLLLGRFLGGIATSLLFSVFDSWLVKEHYSRGFAEDWLANTFSLAMFGNSLVAIVAGVVAQKGTDMKGLSVLVEPNVMYGGYCTPFDLAIVCLAIGSLLISSTWTENFGDANSSVSLASVRAGARTVFARRDVLLTGLVQSLFEGSMFTFVFLWTPALTPDSDHPPPYGLIFATFMVSCMAGSSVFSLMAPRGDVFGFLPKPVALGAIALAVPVMTSSPTPVFLAFLVFEMCVGMYFPAMGTIKSRVVPEENRSTIYNLFRVPLNLIVLVVLLVDISVATAMMLCTAMLATGAVLASMLATTRPKHSAVMVAEDGEDVLLSDEEAANSGRDDRGD